MKVFIGADHRGVGYKSKVNAVLEELGCDVIDVGAFNENESCDYPKIAYQVGTRVAAAKNSRGILICMSGIGQSIAANKVKGCFAALCYNVEAAALARQHNNANTLVISSKFVKPKDLKTLVKTFLETGFEGGRHLRRVNQMKKIEQGKEI